MDSIVHILDNIYYGGQSLINPITQMLKTFIISNTRLLNNRDRGSILKTVLLFGFFYFILSINYDVGITFQPISLLISNVIKL